MDIFSISPLALILLFLFFVAGIKILNLAVSQTKTNKLERLPYISRGGILTPTELKFYKDLYPIIAPHWHLFTKVRMEDIIQVKKGLERKTAYGFRSRIKSRHIDFVLCDKETLGILMCIELDDPSHLKKKQQQADAFKNEAMRAAGITLTRIPTRKSYSEEYLKGCLFEEEASEQEKLTGANETRWQRPTVGI